MLVLIVGLCYGTECPTESVYNVPIVDPTKPAVWSRQFQKCTNLTTVTLANGFTEIAPYGFYGCSNMVTVVLPNTMREIAEYAFYGCSKLTTINLEEGIEIFGFSAFRITGLTSVVLPSTVTAIGTLLFAEAWRLTNISFRSPCEDFMIVDNQMLLNANGTRLIEVVNGVTDVVIPDTVQVLGSHCMAFCHLTTLPNKKLIIPDSVTTIEGRFIFGTNDIATVYIGKNVTFIGNDAFETAYHLTRIEVSSDNSVFESDSAGILYKKGLATMLSYPLAKTDEVVAIRDNTVEINVAVFSGNRNLKRFTVSSTHPRFQIIDDIVYTKPDSQGKIEAVICPPGKTGVITVPSNTVRMRTGAFYLNYASQVVLPEGLKTIEYMAFRSAAFTSCNIPSTVTFIANRAFFDCNRLTSIDIPDAVDTLDEYIWHNCLTVTTITIRGPIKEFPWGVFSLCSGLTDITFPDTVEIIGREAFEGCTKLKFFPFPEKNLTEIRESAFSDCVNMNTTVTIPYCVKLIDKYAFARCAGINLAIVINCATFVHYQCFYMVDNLQYTCVATVPFTPPFSTAPSDTTLVCLFSMLIGEILI